MMQVERELREVPCPRCGIDAQWSFVDAGKTSVEIFCPDCGRFVMPREDFDRIASENTELGAGEQ